MKTSIADPWSNGSVVSNNSEINGNDVARFEDSFVSDELDLTRLSDSEQYLARLYSRLKSVKGGTSKKDLISSLSDAKEDCIARLVSNGQRFESEEEAMLAANPVIRHIAPHLQALTASELVHLLKADVLQNVTDEQNGHDVTNVETGSSNNEQSRTEQISSESLEIDQATIDELHTELTRAKLSEADSHKSEQNGTENSCSGTDS